MRLPTSALALNVKLTPATCGKRPLTSSTWLTPFSSAATRVAPEIRKVESVFWNGRTVRTSPIVTSPASIEARIPPEFAIAISTPWSFTRSSIASATRLPIAHSCTRQIARSPAIASAALATTLLRISSNGAAASAIRAFVAASSLIAPSTIIGSPTASVISPASLKVTFSSPRNLP